VPPRAPPRLRAAGHAPQQVVERGAAQLGLRAQAQQRVLGRQRVLLVLQLVQLALLRARREALAQG